VPWIGFGAIAVSGEIEASITAMGANPCTKTTLSGYVMNKRESRLKVGVILRNAVVATELGGVYEG